VHTSGSGVTEQDKDDIRDRILADSTPFDGADIPRILGLSQDNFEFSAYQYNSAGQLEQMTIKIYDDAPANSGANVIGEWLMEATYDVDGLQDGYMVSRVS